jgi:hypothetical protein
MAQSYELPTQVPAPSGHAVRPASSPRWLGTPFIEFIPPGTKSGTSSTQSVCPSLLRRETATNRMIKSGSFKKGTSDTIYRNVVTVRTAACHGRDSLPGCWVGRVVS